MNFRCNRWKLKRESTPTEFKWIAFNMGRRRKKEQWDKRKQMNEINSFDLIDWTKEVSKKQKKTKIKQKTIKSAQVGQITYGICCWNAQRWNYSGNLAEIKSISIAAFLKTRTTTTRNKTTTTTRTHTPKNPIQPQWRVNWILRGERK